MAVLLSVLAPEATNTKLRVAVAVPAALCVEVCVGVAVATDAALAAALPVAVELAVLESVLEAEGLANAVSESDSACQLLKVLTPTAERVTCAPAESPVGAVQAAAAEAFCVASTWVTPLEGLEQTDCAVASPTTGATKPLAELEL